MENKVLVLDGGLASTLEEFGCKCDGDPLWSAGVLYREPQKIYKVHSAFLESGAEILISASYQASLEGFKKYLNLTAADSLELIKKSVHIAKKAAFDIERADVLIAGSVGPYGAHLADGSEYNGNYVKNLTEMDLMRWHEPRISALIEAGTDLLAIETIPSLIEAKAILKLLMKYKPHKAWVTFSCRNEYETNFGDQFSSCVEQCSSLFSDQLMAIGVNCSRPDIVSPLLSEASKDKCPEVPYIVYPNSGEEWDSGMGWLPTEHNVKSFVDLVPSWIEKGSRIIGGCCRVGPSQIKEISVKIKSK